LPRPRRHEGNYLVLIALQENYVECGSSAAAVRDGSEDAIVGKAQ